MGVPKFFRWLSERYPRIIQRFGSRPTKATCEDHFGKPPPDYLPPPDPLSECGLAPEVDRLYIDMNGIIHGCSHNNADLELNPDAEGVVTISEEEIFRNVSYYLDRLIKDIAQPNELVYMAIDGVAPRAKLNQQRARRYRSGQEGEIEQTVYDAHVKAMEREQVEMNKLKDAKSDKQDMFETINEVEKVKEIQPGRFTGKFETIEGTASVYSDSGDGDKKFHSNAITPGTEFFQRCTDYLEQFIQSKVAHDPAWQKLTIVFSGPHVPGEGEHKIMQFMREQQARDDYNPNLRHCIVGQDGDLVMLSLATHEPNLVLLREQVVFSKRAIQAERLSQKYGLEMYIHNPNFEFMHMNLLRDYLALEFRTSNVLPNSAFDLEHTVDDFVFMTFLVGNDFLPHMPAMDIADEAFDLIFFTYRELRKLWLRQSKKRPGLIPYLTHEGNVLSGQRLEEFLTLLGQHELKYYDYKKANENLEETRRVEDKYGYDFTPSDDVIVSKEESDRARFRAMLQRKLGDEQPEPLEIQTSDQADHFTPVLSGPLKRNRAGAGDELEDLMVEGESAGLFTRMGNLLQYSIASDDSGKPSVQIDDQDVKGRYYYDKFGFSPFDAEKHLALRKAYIEGLVWNLKYYYEGCVSWEWYYPYHYGPMLSDLVGLEKILKEISFVGTMGQPLLPFEQLMACMPPSHAILLPEPYRPLMTDADSQIAIFYPRSFTIDMNGKRWPWEAVVLLPFIDSKRLIEASKSVDHSLLTQEERNRNKHGEPVVFTRLAHGRNGAIDVKPFSSTSLNYTGSRTPLFRPKLKDGIKVPLGGLPTLCDGHVESVGLKSVRLNVHGVPSRYKTACLELRNEAPEVLPAEIIAPHLIGTVIHINYPHLTEAFVTAVSDQQCVIRGNRSKQMLTSKEASERKLEMRRLMKKSYFGDQLPGSGGVSYGKLDSMMEMETVLHVRPLRGLETMDDGRLVKCFAKFEVEVPLSVTAFLPHGDDMRLARVPVKLEEDPFYSTKTLVGRRNLKGEESTDKTSKRSAGGSIGVFSYNRRRPVNLNARNFHTGPGSSACPFPLVGGDRFYDGRFATATTLNTPYLRRGTFSPNAIRAPRTFSVGKGFSLGLVVALSVFSSACASVFSTLGKSIFDSSQPVLDLSKMTEKASDSDPLGFFRPTPPLEFEHGTTTLSFVFEEGIIAAVDSRASLGSFVGSKTVQKVLPINTHMIGTMAGGAADCSFWIRQLSQEAAFYELSNKRRISVTRAASLLSNALYENQKLGLSVGTMIMGYDDDGQDVDKEGSPPKIFYVDNTGARISGDMFAVGSGSTFALGILDTERKFGMTAEEAIDLGIKAIRHATFRDAYSGGFINVFLITRKDGWRRVYSEDLSRYLRDPSNGKRLAIGDDDNQELN